MSVPPPRCSGVRRCHLPGDPAGARLAHPAQGPPLSPGEPSHRHAAAGEKLQNTKTTKKNPKPSHTRTNRTRTTTERGNQPQALCPRSPARVRSVAAAPRIHERPRPPRSARRALFTHRLRLPGPAPQARAGAKERGRGSTAPRSVPGAPAPAAPGRPLLEPRRGRTHPARSRRRRLPPTAAAAANPAASRARAGQSRARPESSGQSRAGGGARRGPARGWFRAGADPGRVLRRCRCFASAAFRHCFAGFVVSHPGSRSLTPHHQNWGRN